MTWERFKDEVRRFSQRELLSQLAVVSASQHDGAPYIDRPDRNGLHPWTIAEIARESLGYGNVHRSTSLRPNSLRDLADAFGRLEDPYFSGSSGELDSFVVRTAYEQFDYQEAAFPSLARFPTLFDRTWADYEILSDNFLAALLGSSVLDYYKVGFLLLVGCQMNAGQFDINWIEQPQFTDIRDVIQAPTIRQVAKQSFTRSLAELADSCRQGRNSNEALRRYDVNPLAARPFVEFPEEALVAPSTHLVAGRISLRAVYFAGVDRLRSQPSQQQAFTRDIGKLLERYVGEQLRLVPTADVTPEREYAKGAHSVDWILAFNDLIVCIEVKSARVAQAGRLSVDGHLADVQSDVGSAMGKQIPRTVQLIQDRHPTFADLPVAPIRGVVVTAEPHYLLNSPEWRNRLPDPTVQTVVLSLRQLEDAVAWSLRRDSASVWRELTSWDPHDGVQPDAVIERWHADLGIRQKPMNPLLEAGYEKLTFDAHSSYADR